VAPSRRQRVPGGGRPGAQGAKVPGARSKPRPLSPKARSSRIRLAAALAQCNGRTAARTGRKTLQAAMTIAEGAYCDVNKIRALQMDVNKSKSNFLLCILKRNHFVFVVLFFN
jgi:hypothetical protein